MPAAQPKVHSLAYQAFRILDLIWYQADGCCAFSSARQGLERRRLPGERELYASLRSLARYQSGPEHDELVEGLLTEQVRTVPVICLLVICYTLAPLRPV